MSETKIMEEIPTIEKINGEINKYHNPSLIQYKEAPNFNIIYHLYNDGSITQQKGGFAYLNRSEFDVELPITVRPIDLFDFPKGKGAFRYAIMTKEDAVKIRNMMTLCVQNKIK